MQLWQVACSPANTALRAEPERSAGRRSGCNARPPVPASSANHGDRVRPLLTGHLARNELAHLNGPALTHRNLQR